MALHISDTLYHSSVSFLRVLWVYKETHLLPQISRIFQHFNPELVSKSANFEPHHHVIHYAHNSLQLLSDFLTIIFLLLGLRAISQMMPNYDMCWGLSEPALGFRRSLAYVTICLYCSSRTFWIWSNNFTTHTVKLFAFVWKQRWSISIICMYISLLFWCCCLYMWILFKTDANNFTMQAVNLFIHIDISHIFSH